MKLFALAFVVSCGSAFANPVSIVKGSSSWSASSIEHSWSPLEQLGAEKSAEDNAVQNCKARGLDDCVVISSQVDSTDALSIKASALARGSVPSGGVCSGS